MSIDMDLGIVKSRKLDQDVSLQWTPYGNNDFRQGDSLFRRAENDPVTNLPVFFFTKPNSKQINFIIHPFYKFGQKEPHGWVSTKKNVANSMLSLGPKIFMMFDKDYEVRNYVSDDICKHRLFISGNMTNYNRETMSLAAFITISNP